jgi:predicted nucleotidyltransferase
MMINPYREILQALQDAGVRYLVIGGVAVNLHGYRRFTGDIDILLALEAENLEKMTALMHQMGYVERLPMQLRSLSDHAQVEKWIAEKGMTAYSFLSNDQRRINIDVLAGASLRFEDFDSRKVTIDLEKGLKVPVIAFDDLLAMKREAGRKEDTADVRNLLEYRLHG